MKKSVAWAFLALMLLLTLGPAIAEGFFWAPGDGIVMFFPQRQITAWALAHGELPFWNPHIFGGMPFLANMQSGVLYPGNWPGHFFSLALATNVTVFLAYAVLIAGMWAFASALALPIAARLVAALVFPFGGFMALHVEHIAMVHVGGLLPWGLWALERHTQSGWGRYRWVLAFCVTGMVLAGHPQMMAYSLILLGAYALWLAVGRPRGDRRSWLISQLGVVVLGVGMSLMQLLPTLDLIRASNRQSIDFTWLTSYSVPPVALPGLVFGGIFGYRDPFGGFNVPMWASLDWLGYLEGYVGVTVLLLALVAIQNWRAQRAVRFWGLIALAGLLLAMGRYTPLYRVWACLPVVNQMPYASRHYFEATFALALLAAYGLAWLEGGSPAARKALVRAGGVLGLLMGSVLAAVGLYGPGFATRTQPYIDHAAGHPLTLDLHQALSLTQPAFWVPVVLLGLALMLGLRPGWARWGLPLLIAVDLWGYNRHQGLRFVLPKAPPTLVVNPAIDWRAGRSLALSVERYPNCYDCDVLANIERYHYPTLSALHGEATVNGYDAFLPARYGRLFGMDSFGHAGETAPDIWDKPHHALDLLGLTTLRLAPAIALEPAWQARIAGGRWQRLADEAGLVVLHNDQALPHAWRVTSLRTLQAPAVELAIAGKTPFRPLDEALLESDLPPGTLTPGSALATSPSLNRMHLETAGTGSGFIVLGSGYDPGWRAWAGRQELTVVRVDAVLLGVWVPPGKQVIELVYEPPRWRLGLTLAFVSFLLLLSWLAVARQVQRVVVGSRPRV